MSTSRIHKRGRLNLKQSLGDTDLTEFVFVDGPHEGAPREMSEQQNQKIAATIRKNPERAARSMTIEARLADEILKAKKQPL